ncbi:unnamed protein product, partial [Hymenolepis diminuta]
ACTPERDILACLGIQGFLFFSGRRPAGWLFCVGLHWFSRWGGLWLVVCKGKKEMIG